MKHLFKHLTLGMAMLMTGCMADIRTDLLKSDGLVKANEEKGKSILDETWEKHGMDNISKFRTYSFEGTDVWKGMMGRMGKPWPEAESDISFKYAVGTFDSKAKFKNGKRAGTTAGLQSWNYYEIEPGSDVEFKEMNERIRFGLSAYHYFFEMPDRLKKAPIVTYAGERTFRNKEYDIVFATWEKLAPHMEHDQYQLWINKETGLLDFAVYSLRENYLKIPGYKAFYGSIEFEDYREIKGVLIPHQQTVYLNSPNKNAKNHIHRLKVSDFSFDSFDLAELYPDSAIENVGDSKKIGADLDSQD